MSDAVAVVRLVDGGVVIASARVPGTSDSVVLLDPDQRPDGVLPWHPFHNVLRVTDGGEVLWRADLIPNETTAKCWLRMKYETALRVWTYSYDCELDPETGRIIRSRYTK